MASSKALDGGWGWAIVAASFMAQLLAYGSPQSVGVLYPEWLHTFQEGKGMTAWVGSLVAGVGLIASPVCSACVDNFGARPVTVFSGVMVAGGLMLSAFAPNVQFLIFSYGIVVGLGCGLVYAATLTITCQYFDKRRGLALGIVTTGTTALPLHSALGFFMFTSFMHELLGERIKVNICRVVMAEGYVSQLDYQAGTSVGAFIYATAQNELIVLFGLDGCLLIIGAIALNLMACAGFMRPLNMPGYYLKQKAALERNTEEQLLDKPPLEDLKISHGSSTTTPEKSLTVKELLISTDAQDLAVHTDSKKSCCLSGIVIMKMIKKKQRAYSKYIYSMYEILQDQAMVAYCIALFLFSLGAFPPVLFIEDVAQSEGLIEEVSVIPLVSIGAISTCVGKLVLGMLVDIRWINSIYLYGFTMFAGGLALFLIPITKTYVGLQILSAVLGFFSGNWSLTSYITTKIVGIERLTQAHGILMFFGGFGIMLGPPVVGWFFDWTQSYDLAFYFSGTCVVLGAFILFFLTLPCWNRKNIEKAKSDVPYTSTCEKVISVA